MHFSRAAWELACGIAADNVADYAVAPGTLSEVWLQVRGLKRWAEVRGPIGACALSMARLGWSWCDPFSFIDELGVQELIEKEPITVKPGVKEQILDKPGVELDP